MCPSPEPSASPLPLPAAQPGRLAKSLPFTAADRALLASCEALAHGLAELFGPQCEVVLHSLEDLRHSVVCIVNGHITGRAPGSPITDLALNMLREIRSGGGLHQTYFNTAKNGHLLKSATIAIRNGQDRVIGLLCINLDLDAPLRQYASALVPPREQGPAPARENYASTVADLLEDTVDAVVQEVETDPAIPASQRNKRIVTALFDKGVFEIKDAIHYVTAKLKVTRHTVYMHIRHRRQENG